MKDQIQILVKLRRKSTLMTMGPGFAPSPLCQEEENSSAQTCLKQRFNSSTARNSLANEILIALGEACDLDLCINIWMRFIVLDEILKPLKTLRLKTFLFSRLLSNSVLLLVIIHFGGVYPQ